MISLSAKQASIRRISTDITACLVFEDRQSFTGTLKGLKELEPDIERQCKSAHFTGKKKESIVCYPKRRSTRALVLIGLGKRGECALNDLRKAGAACASSAKKLSAHSLGIVEPDADWQKSAGISGPDVATALSEGAVLSLYRFNRYITEKDKRNTLKRIEIIGGTASRTREYRKGTVLAAILCEGTYLARDLANAPGNEIYPQTLAQRAAAAGKQAGFRVTVLNEGKIRALKMGGLLGVSAGSSRPPRFIIMEHNAGRRKKPTIVLVGKGVTFDSGGISIKPSQGLAEMKMDMSGAAAVIGAMFCVAKLGIPMNVIGLVPATENLLGGSAMKPGDILTHFNGKTSEVDNTDAEGRLILADALSFASKYKPDLVIDLATLTGACVVALGQAASGMMGNHQESMDDLTAAGYRAYERVWQLPLFEEYERLIKSDVADVKNVGGRWAGAITAALFLKHFIGDYPWIHLDIAGTAILEKSEEYIPRGGSGVGVRLLTDYLRHRTKQ